MKTSILTFSEKKFDLPKLRAVGNEGVVVKMKLKRNKDFERPSSATVCLFHANELSLHVLQHLEGKTTVPKEYFEEIGKKEYCEKMRVIRFGKIEIAFFHVYLDEPITE
ncbi:hypothetical protein AVEN_126394-1 [Araneus ventricosus]|uniref:Uncharacterized protein n=1 Tax=Araneus ventricosus TaxID=182803 RepID=A0A4Y2GJU5_ARAVE|nr:hypothetical protein AVEN_126394-1 [Araneus ventricosus]